jgi:hypothetical protein
LLGLHEDGYRVEASAWKVIFDDLMDRIAGRFGRVEPHRGCPSVMSGGAAAGD